MEHFLPFLPEFVSQLVVEEDCNHFSSIRSVAEETSKILLVRWILSKLSSEQNFENFSFLRRKLGCCDIKKISNIDIEKKYRYYRYFRYFDIDF